MHTAVLLFVCLIASDRPAPQPQPTEQDRLREIAARVDRHYADAQRYAMRVDSTSIHHGLLTRKRFAKTTCVEAEPGRLRLRSDLKDGPFLCEIIEGRRVDASVFRDGRWHRRRYKLGAADSKSVLDFLYRDRDEYFCLGGGASDNLLSPTSFIRRSWVRDIRRGRWLGRKKLAGELCDIVECDRREASRRETYFIAADGSMRRAETRIFRLWNSVPSIDVIDRYAPLERPFAPSWTLDTLESVPAQQIIASRDR